MLPIPPVFDTYVEGLKSHDVAKIATTVSDDLAFVSATRTLTKPEFLEMIAALYTGFPDWHYDHDAPYWQDDLIVVKWRQSGTHNGVFAMPGLDAISPTGRHVTIPEQCFYYRVREDSIVMIRPDVIAGGAPRGILEQIGVEMPPL